MACIMVLNDGETFTDLHGCRIMRLPDDAKQFDTDAVEVSLADETLELVCEFSDQTVAVI